LIPFELPFTDPVLIFALAMAVFLLAPLVAERYRIPGILGLILVGALIGPNVLNLVARDFTFQLLGTVGLLYLVFLAGLELDLNRFSEYKQRSIVFGFISFGIPMLLAVLVMPLLDFDLLASLLIGAIIGSHTLLAYPVVSRLGIVKNAAMTTVIGGTLVTDTLALSVLAVVVGALQGDLSPLFWIRLIGILAIYVAAVLLLVPRLGRWFFRNIPSQAPAEFLFLMVVLFGAAYLAGVAGAEPIIGAFLAGLTLNRLIPLASPLMTRVRFVGNALFIPFFLLSVGMMVDPRVMFGSTKVWMVAIALIVLVNVGKFAGAWATRLIYRYRNAEGLAMFGLSVPQAAATLAVTFVGLELGVFGEETVNGVILMILATVMVGPWMVEKYGREIALQEEQKPYDPQDAPERILIPISNPATAESLLDLAFVLRQPGSEEPLYPLMVVREQQEQSEAYVAEAEKMLGHAVIYAAGADVPVVPLTRVDSNISDGIVRGMTETRTSLVVVGWEGGGSKSHGIFGSVLDRVLEQTKQMVMVAKLGHPLNTTARIVVVIPPASDHHPGFFGAARAVKTMANELGADLSGLVVKDDAKRYQRLYDRVRPDLPVTFEQVEGWRALMQNLRNTLQENDLVVVMSARQGTLAWHRELERMPGLLSELVPESFIMLYPSETADGAGEDVGTLLPHALSEKRVVMNLPGMDHGEAIERLLSTEFGDRPDVLQKLTARLVAGEKDFANELRPGVVLSHARTRAVEQPTLFLGGSQDGIRFPRTREPTRLLFVLLSPPDRRRDHLERLAEISEFLRGEGRVHELDQLTSAEEVHHWFRTGAVPGSVESDLGD
jgi:Kef-type K+ transport system membrane component KefB/mannitol/fructose-specific phosphotransferase system IIA component (Ntr-type)/nucleotide-binding universal stress UspA family protein